MHLSVRILAQFFPSPWIIAYPFHLEVLVMTPTIWQRQEAAFLIQAFLMLFSHLQVTFSLFLGLSSSKPSVP